MTDPAVKDSILQSIKKICNIDAAAIEFDVDIIIHINSFISVLQQLGVGLTDDQFEVEDGSAVWDDLLTTQKNLVMIKTYMGLRVRQVFDPPATGFVTDSLDRQIDELGWRIRAAASSTPNVTV